MSKLSEREILKLAKEELGDPETNDLRYHVWILSVYGKLGRVLGSRHLGITEAKWRFELEEADRTMRKVTRERSAA